ncbi:sugar ABC transporter substrate-binding protein [Nocardioides albidus]|uniref:Sugar ABC transporter substrate-binding protein n=1 Tax=Nocardioides albidus TaxID=1517589 RepID=A0A5C4VRJ8_9ACTN|nr:sugar ABC transporter substrate-binding protein [Nocardioides albidus]TNM38477.1 sugar ABC transporter substrate-binding protein [Nocardioides albidus]
MKRLTTAVLGIALLATATTACSEGAGGSGGGDGKKVIGVMSLISADQAVSRLEAAIKREAKEKGFEVKIIDANYDPQKEYAAIQTFVSQKVDGIINIAGDNSALAGAFRAAKAADIPVVSINAGDSVEGVSVNRAYPDTDLGKQMAEDFFTGVKALGVANPVVVEQVLPEASPCRRREAGFDEAAKGHSDVKIVKYHINGTNAAADADTWTKQYLAGHDNVVGILSCWDVPAVAAAKAAQGAGRTPKDFIVAGFNGTTPAIELLNDAESVLTMTAGFAGAAPGKGAVDDIADILDGGSPDKEPDIEVGVFTKSEHPEGDAIELDVWLPEGWPTKYWE